MKTTINPIIIVTVLITLFTSCGDDGIFDPPAPTASILVSPANNSGCTTGTSTSDTKSKVSFEWNASENTTSYDLVITNLADSKITTKTGITTTTMDVELDKDGYYSWKVISRSEKTSKTDTSTVWSFYLAGVGEQSSAPYPATALTPKSGETITLTNGQYTLSWVGIDPDGDNLTYTVNLDKVDGKQTPRADMINLNTLQKTVQLESNSVYYWRIKSSDGKNSSYSVVYSFRTY